MMGYVQDYSVMELTGVNSLGLLHSLTTNAITQQSNTVIYSCILTPNGRFMYDFMLHQTQGKQYISIHSNFQEGFLRYISMYKMNKEAVFTQTELKVLWATKQVEGFIADPRKNELGYYYIGGILGEDVSNKYHINRIKNIVPDGFYDMTQKESIILEFGLDSLNAISFTKGCYLGQELISRTKHTGVVRKKVEYFASESVHNKGDDFIVNNEKLGKVLGGVAGHYLALVR